MNGGSAVGNPFAAFRHRSYLYYWLGMSVSTIGTWMQNTAQPLLAYKLTNSPFLLGLVGALQFLPMMLFALFAGVIIDRSVKKNILYMTQTASFLITLALAILTFSGHIAYWHLLITSALMGIVNTFDMPARQSFVIELVGSEDLTNGIALNSVSFNMARIVGPAIAALVISSGPNGSAVCFLVNSVSYGAVLLSLPFIRPYPLERQPLKEGNILKNIGGGLRFIYDKKLLLITLLILTITGTFAMNLNVLVPVFSSKVLHLDDTGYGFLMSMAGVGAFAGAMTMASLSKGGPRKFFIYGFPVITCVLVILVAFSRAYILTGILLALLSFFFMVFMANANSTMQLNSTNEYRGRVMSVYALVFAGTTPIGNVFSGGITDISDSKVGFFACGATALVLLMVLFLLLYFFNRRKKRAAATDATV